eukprot:GABV01008533.1.p2 GENE.GABV01008533.1~~GABV01008533.1.p2  ORF type:complete len:440 (+),score=153.75 GABV01008533.1:1670-2989(+)
MPNTAANPVQLPNGGAIHNGECYNRCVYTVLLGALLDGEAISIVDPNNGDYQIRGKLFVNNTEWVDGGFRDGLFLRPIESTFPFQIRIPGSVAATSVNITGFFPPNLAAAITFQSVDVDIDANFNPSAQVLIRTQYQWPFKFATSGFDIQAQNSGIRSQIQLLSDCPDPGAISDDGQDGTTVEPCDQIWKIDLTPNSQQCQLDGTYTINNLKIECQPAFGGDCAATVNTPRVNIDFVLDSEDFCANILDDVEISATLTAYNDVDLTDESRNFIPDQRMFFKSVINSPSVSIDEAKLKSMSITFGNSGSRVLQYDIESPALMPTVQGLDVTNIAPSNTEVGFSFLLTDPPFTLPVDGSQDFVVDVVLEVTYVDVIDENNNPLLLLQVGATGTLVPMRASTSATLFADRDIGSDASTASSFVASDFGVAAIIGVVGAAFLI